MHVWRNDYRIRNLFHVENNTLLPIIKNIKSFILLCICIVNDNRYDIIYVSKWIVKSVTAIENKHRAIL